MPDDMCPLSYQPISTAVSSRDSRGSAVSAHRSGSGSLVDKRLRAGCTARGSCHYRYVRVTISAIFCGISSCESARGQNGMLRLQDWRDGGRDGPPARSVGRTMVYASSGRHWHESGAGGR